jgi:hypothetical protein
VRFIVSNHDHDHAWVSGMKLCVSKSVVGDEAKSVYDMHPTLIFTRDTPRKHAELTRVFPTINFVLSSPADMLGQTCLVSSL